MKTFFSSRRLRIGALAFIVGAVTLPPVNAAEIPKRDAHTETAVLAGGCFWGMQAVFERLRGVRDTTAGYAGGNALTAHYEIVSTGTTGHAESVRVTFDPSVISYKQLLDVYFLVAHDPTTLDRQDPDDGTQYRSEIFTTSNDQAREAKAEIAQLTASHAFGAPIVTKIEPLHGFYAAEAYHQHFYDHNLSYPYIAINDVPKVEALRKKFPALALPESQVAAAR